VQAHHTLRFEREADFVYVYADRPPNRHIVSAASSTLTSMVRANLVFEQGDRRLRQPGDRVRSDQAVDVHPTADRRWRKLAPDIR
jgi:hypothetical protein